jgi:hypothetical protein
MRFSIFCIGAALCVGCHKGQPKMTDEQVQKMRTEEPYLTKACIEKLRWNGVEAFDPETCIERLPAARWRGLWRDSFEAQVFCPAPAQQCPSKKADDLMWIEVGKRPAAMRDVLPGGLYAIDFIGRATAHGTPMRAYGMYRQDIVVDRMISIRQVEAPPK